MKRVQFVRHIPEDAAEFTGLEGEVTIEKETWVIRVHDGMTPGGFTTLTLAMADARYALITDFNTAFSQFEDDINNTLAATGQDLLQKFLIARSTVLDRVTALPGGPVVGDRYLIANAGTVGIAVGHENQVAEYLASGWLFSGAPKDGQRVFDNTTQTVYIYEADVNNWNTTDEALETVYITPINAAIALKAPLASPALTGTPTAPTPPPGDASTKLATTEFVTTLLSGTLSGGLIVADNASVAAAVADNGKTFLFKNIGVGKSITLPPAATCGNGWSIRVKIKANDGEFIVFDPNGAETIDGVATRIGGDGTGVVIACDGVQFYTTSGEYILKSAYQAFVAAALTTFTHNFGVKPDSGRARLKCISAEAGYTIGDVMDWVSTNPDNNQGQLNIIHHNDNNNTSALITVDVSIGDKGAHNNFGALTAAKWNIQIIVTAK